MLARAVQLAAATALAAATVLACSQTTAQPLQPFTEPGAGAPNTATLLVYADFRCPFCANFAVSHSPRLALALQDQILSGHLSYEYRHFPILGPESTQLARIGACATEQGKFQPFHDALYHHQYRALNDPRIDKIHRPGPELAAIYSQTGLNSHTLAQCLASPRPDAVILSHMAEADHAGVRGTPTLVLNGRIIRWDSLDSILSQIRSQLPTPEPPS